MYVIKGNFEGKTVELYRTWNKERMWNKCVELTLTLPTGWKVWYNIDFGGIDEKTVHKSRMY